MQESLYPVAGCPCAIALVSDLHEKPCDAVLASLRKRRPALICVTGDFLFGTLPEEDLKVREAGVLPFFAACAELAPCCVSLGNHEWPVTPADLALVRDTGVVVLDNAWDTLEIAGRALVIGGLSSARVSVYRRALEAGLAPEEASVYTHRVLRRERRPPELSWLDGFCAAPGYHLLLCHHPEYYPLFLRERRIELILSGHAHGGQVRLFGQGLYAHGQGILPKLTAGVVDGRLVISRGLANCQIVPRLFNPAEIVYILPA